MSSGASIGKIPSKSLQAQRKSRLVRPRLAAPLVEVLHQDPQPLLPLLLPEETMKEKAVGHQVEAEIFSALSLVPWVVARR
jgi:hypothetical protein